jgi:rRNA maturation protein Nop10
MKKLIIIVVGFLISSPALFAQWKAGRQDNTKHAVLNVCPVHSTITIKEPGKCPFCGMDLSLSQKEELKAQTAKTLTCPLNADIVNGKPANLSLKEQMKWEVIKINSNRTPVNVTNNKTENCPKCGMALTKKS